MRMRKTCCGEGKWIDDGPNQILRLLPSRHGPNSRECCCQGKSNSRHDGNSDLGFVVKHDGSLFQQEASHLEGLRREGNQAVRFRGSDSSQCHFLNRRTTLTGLANRADRQRSWLYLRELPRMQSTQLAHEYPVGKQERAGSKQENHGSNNFRRGNTDSQTVGREIRFGLLVGQKPHGMI